MVGGGGETGKGNGGERENSISPKKYNEEKKKIKFLAETERMRLVTPGEREAASAGIVHMHSVLFLSLAKIRAVKKVSSETGRFLSLLQVAVTGPDKE